jgi:hypothetical protein
MLFRVTLNIGRNFHSRVERKYNLLKFCCSTELQNTFNLAITSPNTSSFRMDRNKKKCLWIFKLPDECCILHPTLLILQSKVIPLHSTKVYGNMKWISLILNEDTRWNWIGGCIPYRFSWEVIAHWPTNNRLFGAQRGSGCIRGEKNMWSLSGIEPRLFICYSKWATPA